MQCPRCRNDVLPNPVGFTWWGGMLGSKLINHVECPRCHARFNGKTGADNTGAIAIYMVVVSVIALALGWMLFGGLR